MFRWRFWYEGGQPPNLMVSHLSWRCMPHFQIHVNAFYVTIKHCLPEDLPFTSIISGWNISNRMKTSRKCRCFITMLCFITKGYPVAAQVIPASGWLSSSTRNANAKLLKMASWNRCKSGSNPGPVGIFSVDNKHVNMYSSIYIYIYVHV